MNLKEQDLKNKIADAAYIYYLREVDLAGIYSKKRAVEWVNKRDQAYTEFVHACQDYEDFLNNEEKNL